VGTAQHGPTSVREKIALLPSEQRERREEEGRVVSISSGLEEPLVLVRPW